MGVGGREKTVNGATETSLCISVYLYIRVCVLWLKHRFLIFSLVFVCGLFLL